MSHCRVVLLGRLTTLTVCACLLPTSLPAQSQGASYVVPRTPYGQPDLQGYWTNATYTPLERPDGVTKELYTPEEFTARIAASANAEAAQTVPGTIPDVHYDFTQFALDRSQS